MSFNYDKVLTANERVMFALRALYGEYGYSLYKMSKFEEYDFYARNKEFLVSDNIITFTDTDGRLLALKPDVTLSIIKSYRDGAGTKKLFYNENVYRVSRGSGAFREIMQAGLECIGEVGYGEIREVLSLAKKSLLTISSDCVLEVSSLDVVAGVLDFYGISGEDRALLLGYLGDKNAAAIRQLLLKLGVTPEGVDDVLLLSEASGDACEVLGQLEVLRESCGVGEALDTLKSLVEGLDCRIDFSVVSNMKYYNGIAFCGFVMGVPAAVLRGGQYDKLVGKMGKSARSCGFAVYLDELERFFR